MNGLCLRCLITEWNIQSRGHGCEVCGKPFADKESYHTLLVDEKSQFRRSDVCNACWPAKFAEATKGLETAQSALAAAEEQWLALEMLREELEG